MMLFRCRIALFLCVALLLCCTAVHAEPATMESLSVISQMDVAFRARSFDYTGSGFMFGGCGPSSISNALIGTLGITEHDDAVTLVHDLLYLMTEDPFHKRIVPGRLSTLAKSQQLKKFPFLHDLLSEYEGHIFYQQKRFTVEDIQSALSDATPALFVGQTGMKPADWDWVRDVVEMLYESGYKSTRLCIGFLGGGTSTTSAPFNSGTSGHYITFCIPVDEFLESGTFYLLDSLPRALDGEGPADGKHFYAVYAFASTSSFTRKTHQAFLDAWTVTRINDSVLRLTPAEAQQEPDWEKASQRLSLLKVYGTGVIMLACQPQ